jgi:solute carrier family 25 citrate transporter 1
VRMLQPALSAHSSCRRTKLIDDAKRPDPRYRGLVHGTVSIVRAEGIRGIYRGFFPVVRHASSPHAPRSRLACR